MSTGTAPQGLRVLEKQGMSLKEKPGMSPVGKGGMSPSQQCKMLSKVSFDFPAAFLMDHPAPVALLLSGKIRATSPEMWGCSIPEILSQQRHFPLQWDSPDTMKVLSSSAPVQSLH